MDTIHEYMTKIFTLPFLNWSFMVTFVLEFDKCSNWGILDVKQWIFLNLQEFLIQQMLAFEIWKQIDFRHISFAIPPQFYRANHFLKNHCTNIFKKIVP